MAGASSIASKLQSNFTIGFISNYCFVPGLEYNGSRITNWPQVYNASVEHFDDNSGNMYLFDLIGAAAVSLVNNHSDILPNTTVHIKRYSDCKQFYPTIEADFGYNTQGFAGAEMASQIVFEDTDVIGLFGNEYSSYAKVVNEVFGTYQIPYCTATSGSPVLTNKQLYPYLFRLVSGGLDTTAALFFQHLNVTRIAIIYESDDLLSRSIAAKVKDSVTSRGIQVVTVIKMPHDLDQNLIDFAKIELQISDARYIYLSGQVDFCAKVYFSLAIEGFVGPDFVWIGHNPAAHIIYTNLNKLPKLKDINSLQPWNIKRLSGWLEGYTFITSLNPAWDVPLGHEFYNYFLQLSQFSPLNITNLNFQLSNYNIWSNFGLFDCVLMMLLGFDQFLKENPQYSAQQVASRQLSSNFDYNFFKTVNYSGLTVSPLLLDQHGDVEVENGLITYLPNNPNYNTTGFQQITLLQTDAAVTKIWSYKNTSLRFNGGGSVAPPDGPVKVVIVNYVSTLSNTNGIIILIFAILGIIISCLFGAFIIRYRNEKSVKMASVPECLVIITGCLLCNISIFFYLFDVTTAKCKARIWLVLTGYVLAVTPILMKNARLYFVLKSKTRVNGKLLANVVQAMIGLCFLVEIALLAGWTAKATTKPHQTILDSNSFYVCSSQDLEGTVTIKLLEAWNVILLLCLPILGYLLKDVDAMLNESPALLSIFAILGIIVAVLEILPSNPAPSLDMAQSLCIFFAATLTQLILFAGKVNEVVFQALIENGLLKLNIKSSFDSGSSRSFAAFGAASVQDGSAGGSARGGSQAKHAVVGHVVGGARLKAGGDEDASTQSQSSSIISSSGYAGNRESEAQMLSQSASILAAAGRAKNRAGAGILRGPRTNQVNSYAGMVAVKDDQHKRRPVACVDIKGIQLFKLKLNPWHPVWNVWIHGVCYIYRIRKSVWFSLNTLNDVPSFVLTPTTSVRGTYLENNCTVFIADPEKYSYRLILEFKDKVAATAFVELFNKIKDGALNEAKNETGN